MHAVHLKVAATLMFATFGVAMALATFTGTAMGSHAPVEISAVQISAPAATAPASCEGQTWPHYNAACLDAISGGSKVREVSYADSLVHNDAIAVARADGSDAIVLASR